MTPKEFTQSSPNPQLPHSYYFTTRILVLKFTNKGVFFEEIQDLHFLWKRWYFGTHLREFGENGVNFDVQCCTVKKGCSFGLKSQCFTTKKGFILNWKVSVLSRKRGCFDLKSQCFAAKRGSFSNWRTRMATTFSTEWGSQDQTFTILTVQYQSGKLAIQCRLYTSCRIHNLHFIWQLHIYTRCLTWCSK